MTQRAGSRMAWSGLVAWLVACAVGGAAPAAPVVEFSGPPGSAEPGLALTADGAAVLTWLEPVAERRHALRVAVRTAGRWSEPRTIAESDSFFVNWADFPSLVALADGSWIVHWLARVPGGVYAYHVRLAISRDRGATWSRPITAHRDRSPQEHGFVAMAPWDDSTAALVWLDGREMKLAGPTDEGEGDMTLRFGTVSARGRLGDEVLLDARTCECCQTALARTTTGLVAAYRDRSPEEIRDIAVVRRVDGAWTSPVRVADDHWHYPGCPVNGPALSASGDTAAIAWFTAPGNEPRVFAAFSFDGGTTWGAPRRVDDGGPVGRVDVELLNDGSATVTWLETRGAQTDVRARSVRSDGRASRPWRVSESSDARSSGFPRLLRVGEEILFAWTGPEGIRVAAQSLRD
ncbi:MAG: sialidase family protein [Gemmatimonadales bacterium]